MPATTKETEDNKFDLSPISGIYWIYSYGILNWDHFQLSKPILGIEI